MRTFLSAALVLLLATNAFGQAGFPFKTQDKESSILAYWYNCKDDSIAWAHSKNVTLLHSNLEVYGPVLADSFLVEVEVYVGGNKKAYSHTFAVKKDIRSEDYELKIVENYFRITAPVYFLDENPKKIRVIVSTEDKAIEKWIQCTYHKLYGSITDFEGNPVKSFIQIRSDGFDDACGVWSDDTGYYEIYLPERTYNCFYVNDGNYRVSTLEAWSWHMNVDEDQRLDYKIGTGEVYNLNAWSNNGGFSTYFISFRPMVLRPDKEREKNEHMINGKYFNSIDVSPDLEIEDNTVTINGQESEIYSLQKYFETGKDRALPAYIIQLRPGNLRFGKQTILVEYDKTIEIGGEKIKHTSMGYFQLYLNFDGFSEYY